MLGLDRAPEVKTIRRKIGLLAEAGKAGDWIAAMARSHLQARPEQAAVLYVDGHVRAYQGTRAIGKTYVPRLKFPAPATVETWVCDAAGDPLLVVMAEPAASLAAELRRLIPELRATVGDDRRVLVGFDRGGWSPTLFADLDAAGFDTLTWRKGATADIDEHQFTEHRHTDEHGRTHTWRLADSEITLDITDGPRQGERFAMRQISLFNTAATRQMHILTTRARPARRRDPLPDGSTLAPGEPLPLRPYPFRSRLPRHLPRRRRRPDQHSAEPGQETRLPRRREGQVGTGSSRNRQRCRAAGRALAATRDLGGSDQRDDQHHQRGAPTPPKPHSTQHLPRTRRSPPESRSPRSTPASRCSTPETELMHHAIRIAAFNTAHSLARAILTGTGYTRAADEAHTLMRTALTGCSNVIPDHDTLHIRLDPLSAPDTPPPSTNSARP